MTKEKTYDERMKDYKNCKTIMYVYLVLAVCFYGLGVINNDLDAKLIAIITVILSVLLCIIASTNLIIAKLSSDNK